MEENENVNNFISIIKELKGKRSDIGENISSTDIVIVLLNGMLYEYHMFIKGNEAWEKYITLEELAGILFKEE